VTASTVYGFSQRDRRGLAGNLSLALAKPGDDPFIKKTVRQVFLNYGQYLIDFFLFSQLPLSKIHKFFSAIHGEQILRHALAKGRGAILLSAHIGHWEIGGYILRLLDYPLAVVAIPHNTGATNALVQRVRHNNRMHSIEVNESPFAGIRILQHLRNNAIVAMHGDRDFFDRGRPIAFFGKKVSFPVGPVLLAMNSGAALIPTFVLKGSDGKYFGVLEEPIPLFLKGDRNEVLEKNLTTIARVFEKYIRCYPDQWYSPDPIG
jgi:KDO2-lipid IV(A) lauroyltransferase